MEVWCAMWVVSVGWMCPLYISIYASARKGYTRSVNASNSLSHTPYRYMDNNDHGLYASPYMYVRTCDYIL